jgi:leucyl-tRNA synthetase
MTTDALESFQTRQALQEAYFSIESDLKWYRRRLPEGTRSSSVIGTIAPLWVRLLAPFIPYTCEELWTMVGSGEPVGFASWPQPDYSLVDTDLELSEELLSRTVEDIESIIRLIQIDTESITLYVAPAWKWDIFRIIASASDRKKVIGEIMKNEEMRNRGKEATDAAKQITNQIHRFPPELVSSIAANRLDEFAAFSEVRDFLEREFGVSVSVVNAEESSHPKSRAALPFKPAIVVQ